LRVIKALFRRRGNHGLAVPVIAVVLQNAGHRSAGMPAFIYFLLNFNACAINVFKNCG
jgi:hypothetical protein